MRGRLFRRGPVRKSLFHQFFASFFVLVLIPSMIASLVAYTYVVRVIEKEVDKSSGMLIAHYAEKTDELVDSLQNEMIKQLDFPVLDRFIRSRDASLDPAIRNELLSDLNNRLQAMQHPLANGAFLYFTGQDIVMDSWNGHFQKDVFFSYFHHFADAEPGEIDSLFTGRKMMHFTRPLLMENKLLLSDKVLSSSRSILAVTSYPFNSNTPEVYLVVSLDADVLNRQISIPDNHTIESAIMDEQGHILAHAGSLPLNGAELLTAFRENEGEMTNSQFGKKDYQVSFDYSSRYRWIYVSMTDLKQLRQPAELIKNGSALFLLFFCLVGGAVSYYLSRKMYTPIREIKMGFENSKPNSDSPPLPKGNEYEMIKQWSELLLNEHKDMSNLLTGVSPVIHEHFLEKVLFGELQDPLAIKYYAQEIGLDARLQGHLAVLCIEIQYYEPDSRSLTETNKSFMIIDLKDEIARQLDGKVWFCQTRPDLIACIVHLQDESAEPRTAAERIQHILQARLTFYRAAIGVGQPVQNIWQLHQSYLHALRLLQRKGLHHEVELCCDQEDWEERPPFDSFLPAAQVNQMLNLYKAGQYRELLDNVYKVLEPGMDNNASAEAVRQMGVDILNTWFRALATDNKQDFSIEQYSSLFQQLNQCVTWEDIKQFFGRAHKELFEIKEPVPLSDLFAEVLADIRLNHGSELSIEQFARKLNMSVGHFSRTFKETVGEKYMDYLLRCRIDAAKQLLLETDLRIDDVASRVGYLTRNSFIKAFRKHEGITPGKYRELHVVPAPSRGKSL